MSSQAFIDEGGQPDALPAIQRARVTRDVSDTDERVEVDLLASPGLDLPRASWPQRTDGSLPQNGDECFVALDETGTPAVLAWDLPGW